MPRYFYYLSTRKERISSDNTLWKKPLPLNRDAFGKSGTARDKKTISYGSYFQAITDFLNREIFTKPPLPRASAELNAVSAGQIRTVSVFLIKHGAFYHPARVEIITDDATYSFILNVAVSSPGRQYLNDEYRTLFSLGDKIPLGFFPKVYAKGCGQSETGDRLEMFLGQWFDRFFEFHLSHDPKTRKSNLQVWGENNTCFFLSEPQKRTVYRKAAMILTACYDPVTTDRIHPWHHAAGDFIVRVFKNGLDVKLITARNYMPMTGLRQANEALSESEVMETLLLFFLDLTIRMRLDRMDGIGEMAWADDPALSPCINGFFQGLDLCASINGLPDNFPEFFLSYARSHSMENLLEFAVDLVSCTYHPKADERAVIMANLAGHVRLLNQCLRGSPIQDEDL